ncbi:VOC family protein [soil metagenome]
MSSYIPPGYHTAACYLICRDAQKALDFYAKAFDAVTTVKLNMPDGSIMHAEFKIGDSLIMLGEENEQWGAKSPLLLGGTSVGMCLYVPDCDKSFEQAVAAGATVDRPVTDQFWGDRMGTVVDPFGHKWTIGTHKKTMTEAEMQTAMMEFMKSFQG